MRLMCVATFLLVAHVRIGGTLPSHLPLDMDTETALVMATSIGGLSWLLNLAGEARSRQISRGTPRHHGLYDSQQRLQQQVDALSPEDRRLLDQVKFQREDNLTPRERRKFANCMKIRGVTPKMAVKHSLPIAVHCKQELMAARRKSRESRERVSQKFSGVKRKIQRLREHWERQAREKTQARNTRNRDRNRIGAGDDSSRNAMVNGDTELSAVFGQAGQDIRARVSNMLGSRKKLGPFRVPGRGIWPGL